MQPTRKIDPEVRVYEGKFNDLITAIKNMLKPYQHGLDINQHIEGNETTVTTVTITLRK